MTTVLDHSNNESFKRSRSSMKFIELLDYIIDELLKGNELKKIKLAAAGRFSLGEVIKNSKILARARERGMSERILQLLVKKPTRTISGVTPIAIMIKPTDSCKWNCIYCPKSDNAPKSYTGEEPAALRARKAGFDPVKQVQSRLEQYENIGHPSEKCELIIMGGTFLAMEKSYKEWFVKSAYDMMNRTAVERSNISQYNCSMNKKKSRTLEEAKKANEGTHHRVIGLTIETRPDVCGKSEIDEMLNYGATRVELGVQHPDNRIYKLINRGHKVEDVINATRLLKNAGFKVLYHIMPGLPGSDKKKDIGMIKRLFSNRSFRPDMLKIYPTLVLKGTVLSEMMDNGGYAPYNTEEAVDVISEFYRHIPKYVRVMRIQRDIPANLIMAGVKSSNLRELVESEIKKKGIGINEIRSREIGIQNRKSANKKDFDLSAFSITKTRYKASGGTEIFLSFENKKDYTIAGFARLRIPKESHRPEINGKNAILRELKVFGQEAEIGEEGIVQHQGLGGMLLSEAEAIAKTEFDRKRMVVISGVGAREYYYKKGYRLDGAYVAKAIGKL